MTWKESVIMEEDIEHLLEAVPIAAKHEPGVRALGARNPRALASGRRRGPVFSGVERHQHSTEAMKRPAQVEHHPWMAVASESCFGALGAAEKIHEPTNPPDRRFDQPEQAVNDLGDELKQSSLQCPDVRSAT
jgi:hypothetical protein